VAIAGRTVLFHFYEYGYVCWIFRIILWEKSDLEESRKKNRRSLKMKKSVISSMILLMSFGIALAQNSLLPKVGGVYTTDFKRPGFSLGIEMGRNFDEMININVGGGFQKNLSSHEFICI